MAINYGKSLSDYFKKREEEKQQKQQQQKTYGMQQGFGTGSVLTGGGAGGGTGGSDNSPTEDTQGTSGLSSIDQIISNLRNALEQGSQQTIDFSRQETAATQAELSRQLAEQRRDYLKNRQALQKDTFLRGRNVLANLANRGLATSGLQQLGDVQRTIATGQQMNELSQAFESARQNLTAQKDAAARAQTQFESQERTDLASQLAGLEFEGMDRQTRQAEIAAVYGESFRAIMDDPNTSAATKELLGSLYQQLINLGMPAGTSTTTPTDGGTGGSGGGGEDFVFNSVSVSQAMEGFVPDQISVGGTDQISAHFSGNALFDTNTEEGKRLYTALNTLGENKTVQIGAPNTSANYYGFNDTYTFVVGGQEFSVEGYDLAGLIMSGAIQVDPRIALSLIQDGAGNIKQTASGPKTNTFTRSMFAYLQEQGILDENGELTEEYADTNLIR